MWAVIGVWKIDPSVIVELRAAVPLMASSKVGTPGFLHGTWTLDGHMVQVYADEQNARRYHDAMVAQGALERPGVECVVWDVAEVGAESSVSDPG
jgi:hypothetical protein